MKTSNILFITLVTFVISALGYEKAILYKESKKIDRTIPFGEYNKVIPVTFKHIVALGGNHEIGIGTHPAETSEIRYKDLNQGDFKYRVSNDTLYVTIDEKFTKLKAERWTYKKIIVKYENLESYTFTDSQGFLFAKDLPKLKLHGKGVSLLNVHMSKIDSVEVHTAEKAIMRGRKPSSVNYLNVDAKDRSDIVLNIAVAEKKEIKSDQEARVLLK